MSRWVYTYETVALPMEEAERLLTHGVRPLLQTATGTALNPPEGDGSFTFAVQARALGLQVAKQVRVHVGVLRHAGERIVLPLRWHADPAAALFPTFDGSLELSGMTGQLTQVTLVGRVTPPLGPVGAVVDAAVLHAVAEDTTRRLLGAIVHQLGSGTEHEAAPADGPTIALTVADVMTPDPLCVIESLPLRTAALLLHHLGVSGLPVVDDHGDLVGVLSDGDLLPRLADDLPVLGGKARRQHSQREARTIGEACSRPARTTSPAAPLAAAVREMLRADVSRLVAVDDGRIAGIVTRHDVLAALVRTDAELADAAREVLRTVGKQELDVAVEWGLLRLEGEVRLHSTVRQIFERLSAIDGLDEIDMSGVTWEVDDELPLPAVPFT